MLEKSLKAINMTKEEFNDYRYTYRQSLINKMEENMPEKYQVITLFNKPVLMSEGRVDAQNVPPDYYAYELRHAALLLITAKAEYLRECVMRKDLFISQPPADISVISISDLIMYRHLQKDYSA